MKFKADSVAAKVIISLISGWLALILCPFALTVDRMYGVYFVWSAIFPLAVSYAWGAPYALIAALGGGAAFIPFVVTESYGLGNILYSVLYLLLFTSVGFLCGEKKRRTNLYAVMLCYSLIYYTAANLLFRRIIHLNSGEYIRFFSGSILRTQVLNNILAIFILVVAVKIIFMLPSVRALWGLQRLPYSEANAGIVFNVTAIFITYLVLDRVVDAVYFGGRGIHTSVIYSSNGSMLKTLMILAIVLVILDYILCNSMKTSGFRNRLISSEEHYRTIFENMIDTYIEVDENGVITCATPSVMDTLGFTDVYVCGRPLRNFFESPESVDMFLKELFENRSKGNAELVSSHYDRRKQLLMKGEMRHPTGAGVVGVITLRDISDYKNAEEKRRELWAVTNAIFESNRDLIWVVSGRDFTVLFCNKAFKDYVMRTRGAAVTAGCPARMFFTEHEAELLEQYYSRVLEKGDFFVEFTTEKEGLILDLSFYPVKISKDNVNISVFAKDMTRQREIENQIIALNEGLEEMVAKRTSSLNEAYGDLESYSYTVTHEFKTPIREIDTYMSIIEEDNSDRLLPESVEDIHAVRKICSETLEMTEKMMMYSRAGYMVFNIEKLDMEAIVKECFYELEMAQSIPAELELYPLLPLDADAFMLKVAISNILSNSFKFSRKKGRVKITVGCISGGGETAYYFRDCGAGFSARNSDELFGLYNRAHTKEFEGTGIGLAVVKKICQRSGGDAEIFGERDVGCAVVLKFYRSPK